MVLKNRFTWMQVHTYFSCFFLPIALLYIVTGVLYLFGIEGGHSAEHEYVVSLPEGWPKDEESAKQIVLPIMEEHQLGKLPEDFYLEDTWIGWFGYKREVFFDPKQDPTNAVLKVNEHDLWHQLLLIHKGHAGNLFWLFAILLGISLTLSVVTGLLLAISVPKLRKSSLWVTFLGLLALVAVFVSG